MIIYDVGDTGELPDNIMLEKIAKAIKGESIDVFAYIYKGCCLGGVGAAIIKENNKWKYCDMHHCSCYGPLDNLNSDIDCTYYNTLKKMIRFGPYKYLTGERAIRFLCIVEFLWGKGYK